MCVAIFDHKILIFDITRFSQPLDERGEPERGRRADKKPNHWQLAGCMCPRHKWQGQDAATQRDELAPLQLIELHPLP
jgi:hypothetical protein